MVDKLDPTHQTFSGRFARESMIYSKTKYHKDLTYILIYTTNFINRYLNRDLKRVVVIEKNPETLKI